MLIVSFPETTIIAKKVARSLKAQFTEVIVEQFPDGETYIRLKHNPENKIIVIIHSLADHPNQKIFEAILAADASKQHGAKKVILIATYLPYMRQDTHFADYDVVSARAFLKTLEPHFNKIFAIDPHLHRIKTLKQLSKKAKEISTNKLIADYIQKKFKHYSAIVGPDKESFQWAKKVAHLVNKKAVILKKTRFSPFRVKIKEKELGENVIIIDDIISTGRTMLETIKLAKSQGAKKIIATGIHGLFTSPEIEKQIVHLASLITTNTIPNKYAKIDVSPLIIEALKKIQ